MIRHRPAAVRNDEAQRRKILEQIGGQKLHERRGVGVDVVRAGRVEAGVAGRADVHHGGHVELDHLFVQGIPAPVGQGRRGPVATRRVGIQIAADEAQLVDRPLELRDAGARRHARRLRKLAHADEVAGVQGAHAVNQVVALLGPMEARGGVADMMGHRRGPRRKDRDVRPALALQLELRLFEALPNVVVADADGAFGARAGRIGQRGDLGVAVGLQRLRRRRVMPVAVDNHKEVG